MSSQYLDSTGASPAFELAGVDPVTDVSAELLDSLAELLVDVVADGASVGFMFGLTRADAAAFWAELLADPATLTWVAGDDDSGRILGTVSLVRATKPNSVHRADVVKLMVHPNARGRGLAAELMATLEATALTLGRTTLVLDTETGSPAEALYERRGWRRI